MTDFVRTVTICGLIGAGIAGGLALPEYLPRATASEQPLKALVSAKDQLFPQPFDPRGLVKYDLTFGPNVSTDVLKTEYVSKIGYGRHSTVTIAHTSSGTYSSDALRSPYVRYPGIDVEKHPIGHRQGVQINIYGSFVVLGDLNGNLPSWTWQN